ncbi:MAG: heme-binding protein, partial [Verrucomicrobia bacterium]|nr:heme-binding protein [Verrucomicrobiota bacterium]
MRWMVNCGAAVAILVVGDVMGYEAVYEKTPVNQIQVKVIPDARVMETGTMVSYFRRDNNLFRTLFRYIDEHGLSMTVPVEADMEPGRMRFFVASDASARDLP